MRRAVSVSVVLLALTSPLALAGTPARDTTVQRTIRGAGAGPFYGLARGPGEPYTVRAESAAQPLPGLSLIHI